MAIQDGARKADPVLLEPVMAVEVVTPRTSLGDVIGDLSRRRGKVQGQEQRGKRARRPGFVPLGEMFGLRHRLRSRPRASQLHDAFERYEEVPGNIAEGKSSRVAQGEPVGAA